MDETAEQLLEMATGQGWRKVRGSAHEEVLRDLRITADPLEIGQPFLQYRACSLAYRHGWRKGGAFGAAAELERGPSRRCLHPLGEANRARAQAKEQGTGDRDSSALRDLARRLLAHEGRDDGDSMGMVDAAERICQKLHQQFGPVIGEAVYRAWTLRALKLTRARFPFLRVDLASD
jgi:hypothetical protein